MRFSFGDVNLDYSGTLIVGIGPDRALGAHASQLDRITAGTIGRALAASKSTGQFGEIVEILAPSGCAASRIILIGLGEAAQLSTLKYRELGGILMARLLDHPTESAAFALDSVAGAADSLDQAAAAIAFGARLRSYRFDRYRTECAPAKSADKGKRALQQLTVMLTMAAEARERFAAFDCVANGVFFARDLVSEPGNILYPASYADRLTALKPLGLEVEVLGLAELTALGMGALLGVAQGSRAEPRLVVLRWQGGPPESAPLALIGKGVTFDSGGLSLKTAKGMEEMKWDMAGSAAVAGAMVALAGRKARANVIAVLALVENMPSANAQRPGDIVTSLSGQTIEVLNTDAEGRLILADALWYAQDRFKPSGMIDLATLTGAIITALGHEHAGLFANDQPLADDILAAGVACGERLWQLPLDEAYDKLLDSDIADVKNIGDGTAGSILGAQFLRRFTNDIPWCHLDIAGTAWTAKARTLTPKGATGWGVQMLDQLIRARCER